MRITPHPECAEQRSRPLEAPVDWAVMRSWGFTSTSGTRMSCSSRPVWKSDDVDGLTATYSSGIVEGSAVYCLRRLRSKRVP